MQGMAYKTRKEILLILLSCISLLAACKTGSKTSIQKIIATQRAIMPADSIIQKQKKGIDLIATGDDPATWVLELDFDKSVSFRSADGNTLNILPAFNKKEITAEFELYSTRTDLGELSIKLFNSSCNGNGNTNQQNRKVEVSLKNILYTGCGKYLYDHQLNDVWILETVNNVKQVPSDFNKGLPYLEFNLQANQMTGSDGCRNINAGIEVRGNRIKFAPFAVSKITCSNKVEKIFTEMLSDKLVDYYMQDGKLFLYLSDDSKISFKRKDL